MRTAARMTHGSKPAHRNQLRNKSKLLSNYQSHIRRGSDAEPPSECRARAHQSEPRPPVNGPRGAGAPLVARECPGAATDRSDASRAGCGPAMSANNCDSMTYFANTYMPDMRNGGGHEHQQAHAHYGAVPQQGHEMEGCEQQLRPAQHHYPAQPAPGMPYPRFPPYDRLGYYQQMEQNGYRPDSPSQMGHMGPKSDGYGPNGHQPTAPAVYSSCKLQAAAAGGGGAGSRQPAARAPHARAAAYGCAATWSAPPSPTAPYVPRGRDAASDADAAYASAAYARAAAATAAATTQYQCLAAQPALPVDAESICETDGPLFIYWCHISERKSLRQVDWSEYKTRRCTDFIDTNSKLTIVRIRANKIGDSVSDNSDQQTSQHRTRVITFIWERARCLQIRSASVRVSLNVYRYVRLLRGRLNFGLINSEPPCGIDWILMYGHGRCVRRPICV
ncbi:Homeotic protein antennapedia [Eumeta japonica]|uniref:Homeotic protein antennapedia n=1 Tax=Eumeta variegata TaxID=151549 RepID=A0A4C1ZC15_EUMVA|nr:Homeotic protein antennapedia [Eumeta japonica]